MEPVTKDKKDKKEKKDKKSKRKAEDDVEVSTKKLKA